MNQQAAPCWQAGDLGLFLDHVGPKPFLELHPWQVNYSEGLPWTAWLLYSHIFTLFLLILHYLVYGFASWSVVTRTVISLIWQVISGPAHIIIRPALGSVLQYFICTHRHTGSFKCIQHHALCLVEWLLSSLWNNCIQNASFFYLLVGSALSTWC